MLCYFKKPIQFFVRAFLVLSFCESCAPQRKAERERAPELRPVLNIPVKLSGRELTSEEIINYFFSSSGNQNACDRLYSIPEGSSNSARFRILESAEITPGSNIDSSGRVTGNSCTWICANPLNYGSTNCRLCKEAPLDLVKIMGRVGIGSHPIYEIALQNVDLPSRETFMQLVSKERDKYGVVLWIFFETYKTLMDLNFSNAMAIRNKIIQERMDRAFPGAFSAEGRPSDMKDSLSLALIVNALPNYPNFLTLAWDSEKDRKAKKAVMARVVSALTRPLPYFFSDSWTDFSTDAVASINASMKSLQTSDPVQHACAMTLLHRNFAQMIRIIGYPRLPTMVNEKTQTTFFEVPFSQLLGEETGTKLAVCPAPGSFYSRGTRLLLGESKLADYSSSRDPIEMSGKIEPLRICARKNAKVYSDDELQNIAFGSPSRSATAEDNLAMMKVLSHQLTAFNPGATWWAKSYVGYPLGEFSDFDTIEKSGSVLPYQYHALALGLLQISLNAMLDHHVVQVDASFKETKNAKEVIGIRLSSLSRKIGSATPVQTTLEAALAMTEVAFKAGAYLRQLPKWKSAHNRFYESQYASLSGASEKYNYKKMNDNFINGLFGATKNLKLLVGEVKLPNGVQIQDQLDQLKVASAMLLATFAIKAPGSTDDKPHFTCATKIVTHVNEGGEEKLGLCNAAQDKAWKKTFAWLADIYQSPLFASYAK